MTIVKHYRNDETLRRSFCRLAEETFGIDFESWYRKGFWTDCYDPYSVLMDGEIVANVSVNQTDMMVGGTRKKLIQLGTVMTKPEYRNRGLIRVIMEEIREDWGSRDMYLFANDSVVDFYPKFGFRPGVESCWTRELDRTAPCGMERVNMDGPEGWALLQKAMEQGEPHNACAMANNPGLILFYITGFMQDSVYRSADGKAWAIAEIEDGELMLHNVFCGAEISLDRVIQSFGPEIRRVKLGFTPGNTDGWVRENLREEDCHFFVRGSFFEEFEQKMLRIPTLSHA